ncbi:MAG: hypothetical protein GC187_06465 [Alphaproteobacteria bacterium]|nr:hypothetical protein [Alphaproteobacteria bacterium]
MRYVNRLSALMCAASLAVLAACTPAEEPQSGDAAESAAPSGEASQDAGAAGADPQDAVRETAPAPAAIEPAPAAAGLANAVFAIEGAALGAALQPGAGLEIMPTDSGAEIAGVMENPVSTARTGGAHVAIPAELAASLAGRSITVTILASSPDGGGLQAAYSTAQRGNSGWRTLALTPDFAPVSFQYGVPAPGEAAVVANYIGLAPVGGTVSVRAVSVTIDS